LALVSIHVALSRSLHSSWAVLDLFALLLGRSTGEDAIRLFEPPTLDLTGSMGEFDAENDNRGPGVDGRPGVEGAEGAKSGVDGMLLLRCIHFFIKSPVNAIPSSICLVSFGDSWAFLTNSSKRLMSATQRHVHIKGKTSPISLLSMFKSSTL